MTLTETFRHARLDREVEKARRAAERAEQTAEDRVQRANDRAQQVAAAVATLVGQHRTWPPPWGDLDQLARADYTSDGLATDAWFGEQTLNKAGKPKGYERFRASIRSAWVTAVLADQGIVIYVTKDGAGVPDRDAVVRYHEQVRERLEQSIARENQKAELEAALFGIDIPTFQLRALADGKQER